MPIPLLLHGRVANPPPTYHPFGEWLVPWRFSGFDEEYRALRAGAGLIDYSTQALIEVRGADRAGFLHRLLSNDIQGIAPGSGCRAALLTPAAKLLAELLVLADAEALWLLCELPRVEAVMQTLERHHFSEDVRCANHERHSAVLACQGPRAAEILSEVAGQAASLSRDGDHVRASLRGLEIRLIRQALAGGTGLLLLVDAEQADGLWDFLRRHGESKGLRPVGWEAFNTARIEAGVPWFGIDMDESNLLPETGLEAVAVSDTKGCYVGQEVIARLATYGSVSRKLMGLRLEGEVVPSRGDPILFDGAELGQVTSACASPALRRPIALGYVKRPFYQQPGTAVTILHGEAHLPARLTPLPFIR